MPLHNPTPIGRGVHIRLILVAAHCKRGAGGVFLSSLKQLQNGWFVCGAVTPNLLRFEFHEQCGSNGMPLAELEDAAKVADVANEP